MYRRLKRPFYVIKDTRDSPLDEGEALGWEYSTRYWGEWHLSSPSNRAEAFQKAKRMLLEQIDDLERE